MSFSVIFFCFFQFLLLIHGAKVENLHAVEIKGESVSISWEKPISNTWTKTTFYKVGWKKAGTDAWEQTRFGTQQEYLIENLIPNTRYIIAVQAKNGVSFDAEISNTRIRVNTLQVFKPKIPQNFQVVDSTEHSISLSWELPKDDGGSDIRGYQINYKSSTETTYQRVSTMETSYILYNLMAGTEYDISIRSINGQRLKSKYFSIIAGTLESNTDTDCVWYLDDFSYMQPQIPQITYTGSESRLSRSGYVLLYDNTGVRFSPFARLASLKVAIAAAGENAQLAILAVGNDKAEYNVMESVVEGEIITYDILTLLQEGGMEANTFINYIDIGIRIPGEGDYYQIFSVYDFKASSGNCEEEMMK